MSESESTGPPPDQPSDPGQAAEEQPPPFSVDGLPLNQTADSASTGATPLGEVETVQMVCFYYDFSWRDSSGNWRFWGRAAICGPDDAGADQQAVIVFGLLQSAVQPFVIKMDKDGPAN